MTDTTVAPEATTAPAATVSTVKSEAPSKARVRRDRKAAGTTRRNAPRVDAAKGKALAEATKVLEGVVVWHTTPGEVRKGKAIDLDFATQSIRERKAGVDKATHGLMWDAALLTYAVIEAGNIGKGKAYRTQGDYADAIGWTGGYVSRLKNIGRAIVVHGVTKASPLFPFLCSHGANAKVAEAVNMTDTAAATKLLERYRAEIAEHGKITTGATPRNIEAGASDKASEEGGEGTGGDQPASAPVDLLAVASDALAAFDKAVKAASLAGLVTREVWSGFEDRWNATQHREVTTLADRERKAAAKATPATVAKAATK